MTRKKTSKTKPSAAATAPKKHDPKAPPRWALPAVRGVQAGRLYYTVMVHLKDVPKLLEPVDPKARPEDRAQRVLNKGRVPKIAAYMNNNPKTYILSALTGTIDCPVGIEERFVHVPDGPRDVGTLEIPEGARVSCLDGQHRRAAIAAALHARPGREAGSIGDESIPIVLFVDSGLARAQQSFVDLNRFGVRIPNALVAAYDQRDVQAVLARAVVRGVPAFASLTETEKAACAGKSTKLFSLGAINAATRDLLSSTNLGPKDAERTAIAFWTAVVEALAPWRNAAAGLSICQPAALRKEYVHAHAVGLHAIRRAGATILREKNWQALVARLADIDWRRASGAWEGRAMNGGQMSKSSANVILTANAIKRSLGLELSPADMTYENALVGHAQAEEEDEPMVQWASGARVEGGDIPSDYDVGTVFYKDGELWVAWDSGASTPADASSLRPEGENPVVADEDEAAE